MSDDETPTGLAEEGKSMIKMISETIKPLLKATLPDIFYKLIKNNKIDMTKTTDPIYLMSLVKSNFPIESEFKGFHVSIHDEFLDCAKMALGQDKKMVTLILICTVIEHYLNFYYRTFLQMQDFQDADITKILKISNLNTKLTWLAHLVFRREIPQDEIKYINKIMELRNKIIHFKAKPGKSWDDGSAGEISKEIKNLDFSVLFQYPEKLQYNLELMLDDEYPDYKKAKELTQFILDKLTEEQIQKSIEQDLLTGPENRSSVIQ